MYTIHALQAVSLEQSKRILLKDAKRCSTNVKEFEEESLFGYYVLLNSWILLFKSYTKLAWSHVLEMLLAKGLIAVIQEFQEECDRLVHGQPVQYLTQFILADIKEGLATNHLDCELNINREPVAALLMLLRYPKRFSPAVNDLIKQETLMDFIQTENRTKQLQRREYNQYVIRWVREELFSFYDWDALCDQIEKIDPTDIVFSSGVGFDSGSSLGSKLLAVLNGNHGDEYFMKPFGVRMLPAYPRKVEGLRTVRVAAVPKSYKSARIIAMEDTYRQAYAKRVEYIFRDFDRQNSYTVANLQDQGINQELAWYGSRDGSYATLDASHASDLISKALFREIFPSRFVSLVEPLLGQVCLINGELRTMQMLSTSGHSLTFRLETLVYKAIAQAADRFVNLFRSGTDKGFAWAYGDDTIIPTASSETAMEWFQVLGLKINASKSFIGTDNLYRESCGKEYYRGIDVTSVYFPRFPVLGKINQNGVSLDGSKTFHDEYRGKIDNSLTMLIDLEKKLFPYSKDASLFILAILHKAVPRLTTSLPGTVCSDPWGLVDTGLPLKPRAYELIHAKLYKSYTYTECGAKHIANLLTDKRSFFREIREGEYGAVRKDVADLYALERVHSTPRVKYKLQKEPTPEMKALYDIYRYQHFLQHGPEYEDELSRLLKVSSAPMSMAEFLGSKALVITLG